jgi:hypothetical protein
MKIIPLYFISALFITMFIMYIMYPNPEIIIKYPLPEQEISDVYVDDNDVCYRYHRREVKL